MQENKEKCYFELVPPAPNDSKKTSSYKDFLKSFIQREGVIWQGSFSTGAVLEIRYSSATWAIKKHQSLVKILDVFDDYAILEEKLTATSKPHKVTTIPLSLLVVSENCS